MQNENSNLSGNMTEVASIEVGQANPSISPQNSSSVEKDSNNHTYDLSGSDDNISEVESFILDQDLDNTNEEVTSDSGTFLLNSETGTSDDNAADLRTVDPETQARLEALLEAAGIGKLSTADGKAFADPEVLRKLTSSVSCALDEAAAALTRMRAEQQGQPEPADARSLAEACSDGDIGAVRKLLDEGRSVHETTEEGESLLSLACSAGYYELAQVLLAMRANVEDRGIKGDCTPLMEASSGGYLEIVKLLITNGADVNAQSSAGNTPLHYAACGGYEEVVTVLIDVDANVEEHNENGHTPLMEAASAGHVEVAKILLKSGAGINTHSNEFKESALTLACYKGHLEMVKFLLDAGADQEHKTDEMHTALMEASMDGHVEVARLLLDSGAQVNMPPDSFESPLTLAACGGHVELANLLIERGANLEEVNDEGYTPLMEASREGHEEMVALLLAHGAEINAQTEETQETALTLACCGGFLEVAEYLILAAADIELGCSTPLMESAQEGHIELVKYLLKAGSNVLSQTGTGDTALTYACENGHTDVGDLLLQHGAELEHESEGGRTPLMKAARAGHLCTVQFLISKGADVNRHTTSNDHTVLSLACAGGHLTVVELLLSHGADPTHKLKDGSTMLIEASKGGHTNVVNLLLDFPNDSQMTTPPDNNQVSEPPRVPIQGLNNIVPPQDPNQVTSTSANYTPNLQPVVPDVPGEIDLKDFNIPTRTKEEIRHNMQLSMSNKKIPKVIKSIQPTQAPNNSTVTSSSSETSLTNLNDNSNRSDDIGDDNQPESLSEEDYEYNDDQAFSELMAPLSTASTGGSSDDEDRLSGDARLEHNEECQSSDKPSDIEPQKSQSATGPVEVRAELGAEGVVLDSEEAEQPSEVKASNDIETFINKMVKKAELLNTTREEQIQKKHQILDELQKVEHELQERAQNQMLTTPTSTAQPGSCDCVSVPPIAKQIEQHQLLLQQKEQYQQKLSQLQQQYQQKLQQQQWQQQIQLELTHQLKQQLKETKQQKQQLEQHKDQLKQQSVKVIKEGNGVPQQPPPLPLHVALQEQLRSRKEATARSRKLLKKTTMTKTKSSTESQSSASSSDGGGSRESSCDSAPLSLSRDQSGEDKRGDGEGREETKADDDDKNGTSEAKQEEYVPQILTPPDRVVEGASDDKMNGENLGDPDYIPTDPDYSPTMPNELDSNPPNTAKCQENQSDVLSEPSNSNKSQGCSTQQSGLYQNEAGGNGQHQNDAGGSGQQVNSANESSLIDEADDKVRFGAPAALAEPDETIVDDLNVYPMDLTDDDDDDDDDEMDAEDEDLILNSDEELNTEPELVLSQQQQQQLQQLIEQQQRFYQISDHLTEEEKMRAQQILHDQLKQLHHQQVTPMKNVQNLQKRNSKLKQQHKKLLMQQEQLRFTQQELQEREKLLTVVPTQPPEMTIAQLDKELNLAHKLSASLPASVTSSTALPTVPTANNIPADTSTSAPLIYDGLSSGPVTPNPSPTTSPQMTPPIYPLIDLDAQTESNHDTALTLACAGGHSELVSLLLSRGAEIEHRDKKGFTPLILAATAGHSDIVEILLDSGADIEAQSERTKDTPLSLACSGGRYEVVELLLARGANKEHRNVSDYTPLSLAASGGYVNIIKLLLSHGAEINSRTGSKLGISPLMLAAMNGHTAAVKLLLDMGSDINAQIETNRNTALTLACFQGRHEVVSLLVDRKANIEHRAKTGLTPLMEAASGGYVEVGRVLLDKSADVNAPSVPSSRDTALTIAADKGHYRFVELLLSRGAMVDVKNKKGNSPLWLACNGGHLDVVQLLVKARADIDSQDNRKVSCLMAAFRKGHIKVVKWMVRHVTQFPSDQECIRYTATISDKDLLKKCHNCMEIIVSAKDRQAAEANKNATILLEELDQERSREETKKAAAARKRERKKQKKREKLEKEREEKDKDFENVTPESDENVLKENNERKAQEEIPEEELTVPPPSPMEPPRATTTTTIGTTICTDSHNNNNKLRNNRIDSRQVNMVETTKNKNKKNKKEHDRPLDVVNEKNLSTSKQNVSVSYASLSSQPSPTVTIQITSTNTTTVSTSTPSSGQNVKNSSSNSKTLSEHGVDSRMKRHSTSQSTTSTGIGDLDDFGILPTKYKIKDDPVPPKKERVTKITNSSDHRPSKSSSLEPHPAKSSHHNHHGTTPSKISSTISPKRGHKREEGWKEVTRKLNVNRSKKVTVPANAISRVIGRGGSNINGIRELSGANIEVDKPKGAADRIITIKGSAEATKQAQNLISALIKDPDKELVEIVPKLKNRVQSTGGITSTHVSASTHTTVTTTTSTAGSVSGGSTSSISTMNIGVWSQPVTTGSQKSGLNKTVSRQNTNSMGTQAWATNQVNAMSPRRSSTSSSTSTTTTSAGQQPQAAAAIKMAPLKSPSSVSRKLFQGDSSSGPPSSGYIGGQSAIQQRGQSGNPSVGMPGGGFGIPGNSGQTQRPPAPIGSKSGNQYHGHVNRQISDQSGMANRGQGQSLQHQPENTQPFGISSTSFGSTTNTFRSGNGHQTPNSAPGGLGGDFSPFNNLFSQVQTIQQVLPKVDEQDKKMDFASVAAAGVLGTFGSGQNSSESSGGPGVPAFLGESLSSLASGPNFQVRATSYKHPAQLRNVAPSIGDPGFSRETPDGRSSLGNPTQQFGGLNDNRSQNAPLLALGKVTILTSKPSVVNEGLSQDMRSSSAGYTPRSGQPLDLNVTQSQYTTPDQPMTLPRIESTLNPNAPAFSVALENMAAKGVHGYMSQTGMIGEMFGSNVPPPGAFRPLNTGMPPPANQGMMPRVPPPHYLQHPPPHGVPADFQAMHPAAFMAPVFMSQMPGQAAMNRNYSPTPRTPVASPHPGTPPIKNSPRTDRTSPAMVDSEESPPGGGNSSSASSPNDQMKHGNVFNHKPMPIGGERAHRRTPTGNMSNMGNLAGIWGYGADPGGSGNQEWLSKSIGSTNTTTVLTSTVMSTAITPPSNDRPASQPTMSTQLDGTPSHQAHPGFMDPADANFPSQMMGLMGGVTSLPLGHTTGDGVWNSSGTTTNDVKDPKMMWSTWSN